MEFGDQGLVEDLLYGHLLSLTPCDCYPGVQVVDFGCSQRDCLQILLTASLDLQSGQLLLLLGNPSLYAAHRREAHDLDLANLGGCLQSLA